MKTLRRYALLGAILWAGSLSARGGDKLPADPLSPQRTQHGVRPSSQTPGPEAAPADFRNPALSVDRRVESLMGQLDPEEKIGMLCAKQPAVERLGIPAYDWWSECLHGVARAGAATVFPKPLCTGSAWDPELTERIAEAISDEARAKYHAALRAKGRTDRYEGLTFFSPTLNMARDPRWGRTVECYSEDPLLMGSLGEAFIRGLQGDDPRYLKLAATAKHFAANNEENRRLDGSAEVDMRSLREYYLPAFRRSVQSGKVASVMGAYNALNGVPCCADPFLLTQVLRREWGFDGVVISDGSAMAKIHTHHHYAPTPEEAAALALRAGCDMSLRDEYASALPKALEQGLITPAEIDTALRRVLSLRMRLGMFDPQEMVPYAAIPDTVVECRAHRELALEAARKSVILLKNENVLPLQADKLRSVALIGEAFRKVHYGDYSAEPRHNLTLLEAIRGQLSGSADVRWVSDATQPEIIAPEYFLRPEAYAYDGLVGLTGEYFADDSLRGKPFATRHDHRIDFLRTERNNREMQSSERLSIRWTSRLVAPATADYLITLDERDASSQLWIAGEKAADHSGTPQGRSQYKLRLEKGQSYELRLESRRVGANARISLLWQEAFPEGTPDAATLAAGADAAVVFIRDAGGAEGQDRASLQIDPRQVELVRRVTAANPNTVVVLGCSAPLILTPLRAASPALLCAWIAGQGEAQALCDILFGRVNPSGKSPVTFFADENQLRPLDDYDVSHGRSYQYFTGAACYPFGYGLSYSRYEYGGPKLAKARIPKTGKLRFSVEVTNASQRDGEEIVQCYAACDAWQYEGLQQKLIAFRRVALRGGQTRRVEFEVEASELARWNPARGQWEITPGDYELRVGPSSAEWRTVSFELR